jgi:hypothetical protein
MRRKLIISIMIVALCDIMKDEWREMMIKRKIRSRGIVDND